MLTCKEASFLASKKLDKKLTYRERIDFYLHTVMCSLCRHYAKEIEALHKLMKKLGKSKGEVLSENGKLPEQSRKRIKQEIDKVLKTRKKHK